MIQEAINGFNPKEKPRCYICSVRDGWIFRGKGFVCGHPDCMRKSENKMSDDDILFEAMKIIEKKKAEQVNSELSTGSMM